MTHHQVDHRAAQRRQPEMPGELTTSGMLYVDASGSSWLMNHMRCWAKASGSAPASCAGVIGGSIPSLPDVAAISPRTDGASNTSRTDT